VVDGQHTAIAAATHGSIDSLPCLVLSTVTMAERSAAFVGINHDRLALTPHALWRGKVAAGDEVANGVRAALEISGAQLAATFSTYAPAAPGSLSCIAALTKIHRDFGGDVLADVLSIAVDARLAPISAAVLRALTDLRTADRPTGKARLTAALRVLDTPDFMLKAAGHRRQGGAATMGIAVRQLIEEQVERAQ
jgi:hypothetical protein